MTFPVPDPTYNPKVEIREEDDRTFGEDGQLLSGGVRIVTYVDGQEYSPKLLADVAAEQQQGTVENIAQRLDALHARADEILAGK